MKFLTRSFSFSLLSMLLSVSPAVAEEILVAAASNFTTPMQALAAQFERETGHQVRLAFGSSGRFYAQIINGAPYQLFFSADQEKPRLLEAAGLTVADSRFTYARGSLVLWSADESLTVDGPQILDSNYRRLALANPALAPYGEAALEFLESIGKVEATQSRWVQGENIAQTYQFVETGNAELGFVALSQVAENGQIVRGSGWVIPNDASNVIKQDAVQLATAASCQACIAFMNFVQSPQGHSVITSFGYSVARD